METRKPPTHTEQKTRAVATNGGSPCPPGTTPLPQRRIGAPLGPPATIRRLTRSLRPWGSVVNAGTAYALAGVDVRARATGKCSESLLGRDTTEADGGFRIVFDDDPCVLERLALLEVDAAQCVLEIEWSERGSTTARCPVSGTTIFPRTLAVQLPYAAIDEEGWRGLGDRLEQTRIAHVNAFAQALIAPARASTFGDFDLETRHSALIDLERAFLDPKKILRERADLPTFHQLHDGGLAMLERKIGMTTDPAVRTAFAELEAKVAAYRDLLEVDWVLDPTEIAKGDVGLGVTKYSDLYTDGPVVGPASTKVHPVVPTDLGRYRDYLRTIFTGGTKSGTYGDNLALLEKRFHQDFETYDATDKAANELLVPIVKAILTASQNDYGFGIAPGSIQAKGTKTTREYLDYLIGLSQLSAAEFGRRYRLDVDRSDGARSSRIAENVATLQRFLADGFQDQNEPSPAVPKGLRGRAPFFLYFEEWLSLQKPFFPENVYQPAMTFSAGVDLDAREQVKAEYGSEWVVSLLEIEDDLAKALQRLDQNEHVLARDALLEIDAKARAALHYSYKEMPGSEKLTAAAVSSLLEELKTITVKVPTDLGKLIAFYRVIGTYELDTDEIDPYDKFQPWLSQVLLKLWCSLIHLVATVIPTLLGDCAFALGDYPGAIEYYRHGSHLLVARAQLESPAGYPAGKLDLPAAIGNPAVVTSWETDYDYYGAGVAKDAFYMGGGLPYTVDLNKKRVPDPYDWSLPFTAVAQMVATSMHKVEERYLRLRQGQAMLEWADALYRTDEPSNIQRARELYKSVLWLHGSKPPTNPWWGKSPSPLFATANPARTGQTTRARLGIEQIEAGLNWYGFNDDLVPALRFRPLKDAADRYAAAARSAQQDFLLSMGKLEDSIREGIVNANMLKKASLQAKIAQEQVGIAEFGVVLAQQQVEAVKAQIEAKKQEIADHDSLIGQFGDLIEGYSSVIGGIPGGVTSKVGTGVEVGTGMTTSEAAGMSAAAGGACVMGAMAAFVVIGVMTLDNMADAQLSRQQQLHALEDKALPLAQAAVAAKEREVRIAQYQGQIAAADIELAKALMQFQQSRFLNEKLWSELGAVMKRVMRRYLALGGRYGWLAERALAFEHDRPLDIVRFEYFPTKLQGITGADLLQADLGELDAARLDGIKQTVPVKRTFSLLSDFPLQFAQLKQTGRCTFMTREEPFRFAYPGTYGYRIRDVTMTPRSYSGIRLPRGLLSNLGLSIVSRSDGSMHALMRPPDALPLSEFRLADDMQVYGLPDEALLAFEGSGVETLWELTLPAIANDLSLDDIADVELTFDVRAHYSAQLRETHLQSIPTSVRRLTFFSARAFAPAGLDALRDPAQQSAAIEFDVPAIGRLPRPEANRKLRNVVVMLPGREAFDFDATFAPQGLPAVQVSFADSVAYSNAEPLTEAGSQTPPSPLNVLVGGNVDTTFQLAIAKNGNADAFAGVEDVLLGIEYTADLV